MAIITRNSFAKALYPGVNTWYGKAYDEYPTEYTDLVDIHSSRRAYEEDVGISSFGLAAVKNEGNSVTYDEERQAYLTRYLHIVYALGFIVTKEMVDDDLYDVVAERRAKGLAFSMRQSKETVVANVYNRAFNTSYTGGDGATLVACAAGGSASHTLFGGGTWTNGPSAAVDLSETALEQACIDISKFVNERSLKISVQPQSLIIPYDLVFEAERILHSPYRVSTADNDVNAIRAMGMFPGGIKANHYLTDTDAWFIRTNAPHGLKLYQRAPMKFDMDNDFDTENAKFKATERYSVGWTDARQLYGSPGA